MENRCKICGSNDIELHFSDYPGYVENQFYDIYLCKNCDTNFVYHNLSQNELKTLYKKVYSNDRIEGYDKYLELAEKIKTVRNPARFISKYHASYHGIIKSIKKINGGKILDVGCSFGYLSYLLNKIGYDTYGIDISERAIDYALKNYGAYFENISLEQFIDKSSHKYDVIIASELIEHFDDPLRFFESAFSLLKDNGMIIISTPNKDYFSKKSYWFTDLPPVHLFWFGKKSIQSIADKLNAKVEFVSFNKFYPFNESRLFKYLKNHDEYMQTHVVNTNYEPFEERINRKDGFVKSVIKHLVHDITPIRNLSNFVYNHTIEKDLTMVFVLTKSNTL